jgi:hypothetical protein
LCTSRQFIASYKHSLNDRGLFLFCKYFGPGNVLNFKWSVSFEDLEISLTEL